MMSMSFKSRRSQILIGAVSKLEVKVNNMVSQKVEFDRPGERSPE